MRQPEGKEVERNFDKRPHPIGYADPKIGETPTEQRSFRLDLFAPRNVRQLRRISLIAAIVFGTLFGMTLVNWLMGK